jgi:hypothetical protein
MQGVCLLGARNVADLISRGLMMLLIFNFHSLNTFIVFSHLIFGDVLYTKWTILSLSKSGLCRTTLVLLKL